MPLSICQSGLREIRNAILVARSRRSDSGERCEVKRRKARKNKSVGGGEVPAPPLSPVPLYFSSLFLLRTALHYLNAWNRLQFWWFVDCVESVGSFGRYPATLLSTRKVTFRVEAWREACREAFARLQNSPYFCVFKYARAVKQKVWNEAENTETVRLLHHALPISLLILRGKPTVLQSKRSQASWGLSQNSILEGGLPVVVVSS